MFEEMLHTYLELAQARYYCFALVVLLGSPFWDRVNAGPRGLLAHARKWRLGDLAGLLLTPETGREQRFL